MREVDHSLKKVSGVFEAQRTQSSRSHEYFARRRIYLSSRADIKFGAIVVQRWNSPDWYSDYSRMEYLSSFFIGSNGRLFNHSTYQTFSPYISVASNSFSHHSLFLPFTTDFIFHSFILIKSTRLKSNQCSWTLIETKDLCIIQERRADNNTKSIVLIIDATFMVDWYLPYANWCSETNVLPDRMLVTSTATKSSLAKTWCKEWPIRCLQQRCRNDLRSRSSTLVCPRHELESLEEFSLLVRIRIEDDEDGRSTKIHEKSVRGMGLIPDDKSIVPVSKHESIKLRSTGTGQLISKSDRPHE